MPKTSNPDPRWGTKDREQKALAIFSTMRSVLGDGISNASWLDIGCGNGEIAAKLSLRVQNVVGVDPERWKIWGGLMEAHPRLRLVQGDCTKLSDVVPDGSIGVAVCNQVYEHVSDVSALLDGIYRALQPGGHCYFAGPNLLWPIEPHVHLPFVHWLPRQPTIRTLSALGVQRIVELDAWSAHFWRLKRLFRDSRFDSSSLIVERLASSVPYLGAGVRFNSLKRVVSLFEPLSPSFVFLLTKR